MAAPSYGYVEPNYGYFKPPPPPKPGGFFGAASLAAAAANQDPWGLGGPNNAGAAPGSAPPISYGTPQQASRPAGDTTPGGSGAAVSPSGQPYTTAPTVQNAYDINTDPALQQVVALTGMSDEQAQAAALKQKQDQLLAYGDPNLVQQLLGDATLAQAAGANPTSTLAQLGQSRDRNLHGLTEGLNQANLLYSGYRVNQETQAAQDYQNALAQAASGVNSNLGGIDSVLAQALGQNQAQRIAAMRDAYDRHAQDSGASGPPADVPPGTATPDEPTGTAGSGFGDGNVFFDANDPNVDRNALALAIARRGAGNVGY